MSSQEGVVAESEGKRRRRPRVVSGGEVRLDRRLGMVLKGFRLWRSLSVKDVAMQLNITYQQMQNYEKGNTRLTVGRFMLICERMKWPWAEILLRALGRIDDAEPLRDKELGEEWQTVSIVPDRLPELKDMLDYKAKIA